ncbi:hypothetical protein LP417_17075 [Polaromonas sp. P1-6]|nr:hypothetical protein LP417_17075 [Polaromonas sp. P1-6]
MSTSAPRKPRSQARTVKAAQPAKPRLSRTRRPPELEVADWQTALRRQFGREQRFGLENLGREPVFSDFPRTQPHQRQRHALPRGHPRPGPGPELLHLP